MAAALAMNFCRHLQSASAVLNKGQVAGSRSDKVGEDWESALVNSKKGQVAQLVEQRTENPRVGGSIPPLATILFNRLR